MLWYLSRMEEAARNWVNRADHSDGGCRGFASPSEYKLSRDRWSDFTTDQQVVRDVE